VRRDAKSPQIGRKIRLHLLLLTPDNDAGIKSDK